MSAADEHYEEDFVPGVEVREVAPLPVEEEAPRRVVVGVRGVALAVVVVVAAIALGVAAYGRDAQGAPLPQPAGSSTAAVSPVPVGGWMPATSSPTPTVVSPSTVTAATTVTARSTVTTTRVRRVVVPVAGPTTRVVEVQRETITARPAPVTVRVTATRTVRVTVTRRPASRSAARDPLECRPVAPIDHSVIGGRRVATQVKAYYCPSERRVIVDVVSSTTGIVSVQVYRAAADGVHGVRVGAPVPGRGRRSVLVGASLPIPAVGYAGWVAVTVQVGRETRTVVLHV